MPKDSIAVQKDLALKKSVDCTLHFTQGFYILTVNPELSVDLKGLVGIIETEAYEAGSVVIRVVGIVYNGLHLFLKDSPQVVSNGVFH